MFDPKMLDELARKMSDSLPQGLKDLQGDMERTFRNGLQSTFTRMDLVTREEFDVQTAVLARTREKLELMEQRVAALEAKLGIPLAAGEDLAADADGE
ncbi:MAG: accessory factor UbiK family protein [Chromatiales bacterium]|nr:accessory factor UbiK family protein [Chromatiales bacterium]